jgi:3'-phosphoadenosine 5'-phosphosulfate sulfotransferase (PAPS reductase)/FAD synthetase
MVVLDMCVNTFKRVEAFMMEFVPGMPMNDERCAYAKSRWGVTVRRGYPDPSGVAALEEGIFCDYPKKKGKPLHYRQVHELARRDSGVTLVATGHKRSDSMGRRAELLRVEKDPLRLTPLAAWNKADVLGYLKAKNIPLPRDEGRNSNAIGLGDKFLLWAYDHSRPDFDRIASVFLYAPALIWRRTFYPETAED